MTKKILLGLFVLLAGTAYAASFQMLATRTVYSATNVGTVSWVQLVAAAPYPVNKVAVFDSSGQTLQLGTGSSGAEIQQVIIPPGGGTFNININMNDRVVVRALSGTASTGELDINYSY